ncbi:unnamed protein product [Periconia digitata]|uniref:Chromo domain-containing protein n=1 Tax=Periconia digitata TaxID=1303443 RepID=A0A9W4XT88_9PLEO|nr:unnamed protein product [Periconia digitata]
MPPALSDDDNASQSSSGEEQIPPKTAKADAVPTDDEGSEDEDEDEFVVEKILSHKGKGQKILYEVQWLGYDDPSDRTWEPRDNLDGAKDVLEEYHNSIGGDPAPPTNKRKGRKSAADSESATPVVPNKRVKQKKVWEPPKGSWETEVDYVETVEELADPTTGKYQRFAYLRWSNRKKTQHPLAHVYQKCPQKMLHYYESHLVFNHDEPNDRANGDSAMKDID